MACVLGLRSNTQAGVVCQFISNRSGRILRWKLSYMMDVERLIAEIKYDVPLEFHPCGAVVLPVDAVPAGW